MTKPNRLDFATRCIHAGQEPDPTTGAVMMPIYATSTYVQQTPGRAQGLRIRPHARTRRAWRSSAASPTSKAAAQAFAFASGLAAIATIARMPRPRRAYRRVRRSLRRHAPAVRAGAQALDRARDHLSSICPTSRRSKRAIRPKTKLIWVETPTNPLLKLVDLERVAAIARQRGILAVADNTFASPYVQRPLEFGFDIVVHSTTKYLNGHSDMVGGVAVVGEQRGAARAARVPAERGRRASRGRSIPSWRCAASRRWRCAWSGIARRRLQIAALAGAASEGAAGVLSGPAEPSRSTRWRSGRCAASAA